MAALARIIAHRGASGAAPENTLPAFEAAAAAGAASVEFDVSLLGDGTAVLFHDATLDRCTDRAGPLSGIGRADLAQIDAGSRFAPAFRGTRIPELGPALDRLAELGLSANLEMKPQGAEPAPLAARVAEALAARPAMAARTVVSSFDAGALAALGALRPEQALAMLWEAPPADWPEALARLGAAALHVDRAALTGDLAAEAAGRRLALRVYTVNDPDALAPLPGLSGVITDHPDRFLAHPAWGPWAQAPDQAPKRP